jgi:hypothetical protein
MDHQITQPMATGIEAKVCADIAARQAIGINKYGTTVADNPLDLRQWLEHAYQEALDQAIYLRRAMQELDKQGQCKYPNCDYPCMNLPDCQRQEQGDQIQIEEWNGLTDRLKVELVRAAPKLTTLELIELVEEELRIKNK